MKYVVMVVLFVIVLLGAFVCGYYLGQSQRTVEYVTKRVETIKYVEKKRAAIHSKPNADRHDLLELMHYGKL